MDVKYPSPERIIENNLLALTTIKAKKADSPKIVSFSKLRDILQNCVNLEGDIYDKAVYLLVNLVQKHVFASGNRRTAFISVKEFLMENKSKIGVLDDPENSKIMVGIRENFYSNEEIKEWLKNGTIRKFTR